MFSEVQAVIACWGPAAGNNQPASEGCQSPRLQDDLRLALTTERNHTPCFLYPVILFSFYVFLPQFWFRAFPVPCPVYLLNILLLDI